MRLTKIHKVFVSYHHTPIDQKYRDSFERMFHENASILVSKSVQIGDIDPDLKPETIRQKIRDEYLRDSTVTVVLVGPKTWQRKHVDWEIGSSIRHTEYNPRSGLLGILLPNHPSYGEDCYDPFITPPRLHFNKKCGYTKIYDWSTNPVCVQNMIHDAFKRRFEVNPDNSMNSLVNNLSGEKWHLK